MFDMSGNYAWVNMSSTVIPVYSTLVTPSGGWQGGTMKGHIYQNEF